MKKKSNIKTVSDIALAMTSARSGTRNIQQKTEMERWVISQGNKMANPWSLILTYSHPIAGGAPTAKELARMERQINKDFSDLFNGLSRRAYKNTYKKKRINGKKKLIQVVAFFELGDNDRFHIHAIVDVPKHADPLKSYHAKFSKDVRALWGKHGMVVEVEEVTANEAEKQSKEEALIALCKYIVKLRTKYTESCSYTDSLLLVI